MITNYCTLFDSNYLDKGIVTIDSLLSKSKQCSIFILAMDKECERILSARYKEERVKLISISELKSYEKRLIVLEKERSVAEFSWTCASCLLHYIFNSQHVDNCTYVDADLYFFSNPDLLVGELTENEKGVLIVEHRFKGGLVGRINEKNSGKFCVEFNTFIKNEDSMALLNEWKEQVLESCSTYTTDGFGDQMYLNDWPDKYKCVHVCSNPGAGMAPWNINRYFENKKNEVLFDKKQEIDPVFYHFHNVVFESENTININVYRNHISVDKKLVNRLYNTYLKELIKTRKELSECYSWNRKLFHHPMKDSKGRETKLRRMIKRLKTLDGMQSIICDLLLVLYKIVNGKKDLVKI